MWFNWFVNTHNVELKFICSFKLSLKKQCQVNFWNIYSQSRAVNTFSNIGIRFKRGQSKKKKIGAKSDRPIWETEKKRYLPTFNNNRRNACLWSIKAAIILFLFLNSNITLSIRFNCTNCGITTEQTINLQIRWVFVNCNRATVLLFWQMARTKYQAK